MDRLTTLALMAALLASRGRSAQGAVAEARSILDEIAAQEPEMVQQVHRARIAAAVRRVGGR
jgi:hypothetical protein